MLPEHISTTYVIKLHKVECVTMDAHPADELQFFESVKQKNETYAMYLGNEHNVRVDVMAEKNYEIQEVRATLWRLYNSWKTTKANTHYNL